MAQTVTFLDGSDKLELEQKIDEAKKTGGVNSVNGKTGNVSLNSDDVNADAKGTASSSVSAHNTSDTSHNDIRLLIEGLSTLVNSILDCDDETLNQTSEIVAYIKSNKSLIDSITTSKVNIVDIVDDLTTNVANRPLSAKQGVALKSLIDVLSTNKLDSSALTSAIETALAEAKASGDFKGDKGDQGERGIGIATVRSVPSTEDGGENVYYLVLTEPNMEFRLVVKNGSKGGKGDKGDQGVGVSKAEIINNELIITLTDGQEFNLGNVKGAKGDTGKDGTNGKDGTSVTHSWNGTTLTITSASGTSSVDLKGANGKDGADGKDGTSVTITKVTSSTASGGDNVVNFSNGKTLTVKNGIDGKDGKDGKSGVYVGSGDMPSDCNVQIDPDGVVETPEEFAELIGSSLIPSYVVAEAENVIDKVISAQGNRTFTFAAITDLHYGSWGYYEGVTDYPDGVKHACQALKYIDERIKLDAVAVLGDYTDGMTNERLDVGIHDFKSVNAVLDKLRFAPNLRLHGNHDFLEKASPLVYRYLSAYNDGSVVWGNPLGGYCYRDFETQKIRVICLNTSEEHYNYLSCSTEQYSWLVDSLDLSNKENAENWGILILSHIPVDMGTDNIANILNAYKNGTTWSNSSISCDFSGGKNVAKLIGNIHGHCHNFMTDKLNLSGSKIDVWRMATPNSCFGLENKNYTGYQEDVVYPKTANSSTDTAFCVYCVDLDTNTINAICYGAGYDRTLNYQDGTIIVGTTHSITNNLTNVVNSNMANIISYGSRYSATLSTDGEFTTVTITMGGVDITSSVYSNGVISIPSVTGNVVITAIAFVSEIVNQIPISTDSNGNIYNATDTAGYKANTRVNSSYQEVTFDGIFLTGFIPVKYGDTVRMKNVDFSDANQNLVSYWADKSKRDFHRTKNEIVDSSFSSGVLDENGKLIEFKAELDGFMRVQASYIGADSIITVNQPIE